MKKELSVRSMIEADIPVDNIVGNFDQQMSAAQEKDDYNTPDGILASYGFKRSKTKYPVYPDHEYAIIVPNKKYLAASPGIAADIRSTFKDEGIKSRVSDQTVIVTSDSKMPFGVGTPTMGESEIRVFRNNLKLIGQSTPDNFITQVSVGKVKIDNDTLVKVIKKFNMNRNNRNYTYYDQNNNLGLLRLKADWYRIVIKDEPDSKVIKSILSTLKDLGVDTPVSHSDLNESEIEVTDGTYGVRKKLHDEGEEGGALNDGFDNLFEPELGHKFTVKVARHGRTGKNIIATYAGFKYYLGYDDFSEYVDAGIFVKV